MRKIGILIIASLISLGLWAQEGISEKDIGYNKYSIKQIHNSDVMWKKSVIRAMDLREKQNKPFFAVGIELSRLLLDAVNEGVITPYASDSLDEGSVLTLNEFKTNMQVPGATNSFDEDEDEFGDDGDDDDGWGDDDDGWGDEEEEEVVEDEEDGEVDLANAVFFEPRDLYQIELSEDMIFDNQRSVLYYDIIAITLFVPADHPDNVRGIQTPIATFKFKELVEKVFRDNPKALWFNPYNDAEHRNLEHAFE